jgi:hypothetical protein
MIAIEPIPRRDVLFGREVVNPGREGAGGIDLATDVDQLGRVASEVEEVADVAVGVQKPLGGMLRRDVFPERSKGTTRMSLATGARSSWVRAAVLRPLSSASSRMMTSQPVRAAMHSLVQSWLITVVVQQTVLDAISGVLLTFGHEDRGAGTGAHDGRPVVDDATWTGAEHTFADVHLAIKRRDVHRSPDQKSFLLGHGAGAHEDRVVVVATRLIEKNAVSALVVEASSDVAVLGEKLVVELLTVAVRL